MVISGEDFFDVCRDGFFPHTCTVYAALASIFRETAMQCVCVEGKKIKEMFLCFAAGGGCFLKTQYIKTKQQQQQSHSADAFFASYQEFCLILDFCRLCAAQKKTPQSSILKVHKKHSQYRYLVYARQSDLLC